MRVRFLSAGAALALVLSASPAAAGTAFKCNLVATAAKDPTMSESSKLQLKDSGQFKASLKGVTDSLGVAVTTDGSFRDTGDLTGDEYVTILRGRFSALAQDFEFDLISELNNGSGKGEVDAASLFSLIPGGLHRGAEILGAEVYGPIGEAAAVDCQTIVEGGGFVLTAEDNACRSGDKIGNSGIMVADD